MSTRLLSMKFMQRAAASSPSNTEKSPATPSSDRPLKRQRLSTGDAASPATPVSNDSQAVQDLMAADELKRQQAIDRAGADAGETKWVLSVQNSQPRTVETPLRIVTAGYGAIDSNAAARMADDEDDESSEDEIITVARPGLQGRRSFGKFNKTIERQNNPDLSSSSSEDDSDSDADSDSGESDDDDDENDPAAAMIKQQRKEAAENIRKERRAKKKADQAEFDRLAKERRKKEVNLNRTSGGISSGGGSSTFGGGNRGLADMACHKCGEKGHLIKDCPQAQQSQQARYQRQGGEERRGRDQGQSVRPWKR